MEGLFRVYLGGFAQISSIFPNTSPNAAACPLSISCRRRRPSPSPWCPSPSCRRRPSPPPVAVPSWSAVPWCCEGEDAPLPRPQIGGHPLRIGRVAAARPPPRHRPWAAPRRLLSCVAVPLPCIGRVAAWPPPLPRRAPPLPRGAAPDAAV